MTQEIIIAVITSGAFFTFIQYLITRHDSKSDKHNSRYNELKDGLEKREEEDTVHKEAIEKLGTILELQQKELAGTKALLVGIGHDKLVYMTDRITRRGAITLKEKSTLEAIFVPYHALGGNGDGETGYKYVITLPVVTDDVAREKDNSLTRRDIGISNK